MKRPAASAAAGASTSLVANSRWNLVAFACGLAANFVTVPLVVRWTSLEVFGQAGLVLAVCAPLMLVGTVLGQALVREISPRAGDAEIETARRSIDAALRLCLLFSFVGWGLLVAVGPWLTTVLTSGDLSIRPLVLAFLISASGWLAQQLVFVLQAVCAARQNFRTIAKVAAFSAMASISTTLVGTWLVPSVQGYLLGVAAGFALSLAAWLWVLREDVRWTHIFRSSLRKEMVALMHFGKWQSVAQLAGAFGNQVDRYVLGALAPIAIVGQFNVANRLQEAAYIGVVKAGEVLFPRFGSISASSEEERASFFQMASWAMGTFSAALLAPLAVLAAAVLTLWVGPDAADGGARLLSTLVLGGIVGCGSNVFVYCAMGMGRNAPVAFISVLYSVLTVIFTVVLIREFGPLAAGAGLLVASVARVATALFFTRRDFFPQLGWGELTVSTLLPLAAGVAIVLLGQGIEWGPIHGWLHLIALYAGISVSVLVLTAALSALTPSGRVFLARAHRLARYRQAA